MTLTGATDGRLKLWMMEDQMKCERTIKAHDEFITAVAVDWFRMRAVSGSEDGMLKMWDLATGECKRSMKGKFDIWAVTADWKRMRALCGSIDSKLHLWNLDTGECKRTFTGHSDLVTSLAADWG